LVDPSKEPELGGGYNEHNTQSAVGGGLSYLYPLDPLFTGYGPRTGEIKVVTFLVNIDTLTPQTLTKERVNQIVFTGSNENPFSLNSFVNTASGGSAHLVGTTFGPFTAHLDADKNINNKSQYCDDVISQVKTAAAAQGYKAEDYPYGTIYLYMIPGNLWVCSGCGSSAGGRDIAYVGGFTEDAYSKYALVHEFGHGLGLNHDSSMTCTHNGVGVPISDECVVTNYGDNFSSMGISLSNTMPATYSAYALAQLGWITPTLITSSKDHITVSPIDRAKIEDVPQIVEVPRGLSIKSYFYIYRRMDLVGVTVPNPNGIFIEFGRGHHPINELPLLLKMHANSDPNDFMLTVGETFTDPQTKVAIKLNKINTDGSADVSITYPTSRGKALPTTPTGVSASVVNGTDINIKWNAGTDSLGYQTNDYQILLNDSPVFPHVICSKYLAPGGYGGTTYAASNCTQLDLTISNLTNTVPLSIRVQSRDINGNLSAPSSPSVVKIPDGPDLTPPSGVKNVVATDASTQGVTLSWDASTDDHGGSLGYYFHRDNYPTSSTGWPLTWATFITPTSVRIGTNIPFDPTYPYPYLYEAGKTYGFSVGVKDAAGNIGRSGHVYVTIPNQ
ncbi:MAG: hypothetical protein WCQ47_06720, partial [bacterium]